MNRAGEAGLVVHGKVFIRKSTPSGKYLESSKLSNRKQGIGYYRDMHRVLKHRLMIQGFTLRI